MADIEMRTLGGKTPGNTTPGGSRKWEYLATGACVLISLNMGAIIGWISPVITKMMICKKPGEPCTMGEISVHVAIGAMGHLLAPLVVNSMVNEIGRKASLLLSGIPLLFSSALIMITDHTMVIFAARIFDKFALGMGLCIIPMYLGEIASVDRRGTIVSSLGVMMNIGLVFSCATGQYLSLGVEAGIRMIVTLTSVVIFSFMPESPYFLVLNGRIDDAKAVLEKLRGKTDVTDELNTIIESMPDDPRETILKPRGISKLFTTSTHFRAFIIASLFIISQNCGGFFSILVLIYKSRDKFLTSYSALMAIGFAQLMSSVFVGALIDKIGRKPLILGAGAIAGLANLLLACYLYAKDMKVDVSGYNTLFFIIAMVQIFTFYCSMIITHDVIKSEIFAIEVKAIGLCICSLLGEFCSVIGIELTVHVIFTWGFGLSVAFFISALVVWSSTITIMKVTTETKGKTFVQIQQHLDR